MDPDHDPVLREIRRLRGAQRRNTVYTLVVALALLLAMAGSLWIRAGDLAATSKKNARDQVSSCFARASQRQLLREAVYDPTLSKPIRDLVRTIVVNTPTVSYCKTLARNLGIAFPPPPTFQPKGSRR